MGIGLLLVAGGGVLVYLKYFRNGATGNPPISRVPPPGPGPTVGGVTIPTPAPTASVTAGTSAGGPAPNPEAAAHLAAGKGHQKQAEMLAVSASASAADEERLKAVAEYRDAIKLQPVYPEAHENLGTALYDSGRVGDALDEYRTAIDQYTALLGQPTPQVEFNYGLALFNSRRYREAATAFGRVLELEPTDHDAYVHRAFALQNAGDYQSAKQDYQQYLSLEPSGQYAAGVKQILAGRANPPTGNH
jgi:Flp pilus assembly protein TadD